jgi:hypothetical protein
MGVPQRGPPRVVTAKDVRQKGVPQWWFPEWSPRGVQQGW